MSAAAAIAELEERLERRIEEVDRRIQDLDAREFLEAADLQDVQETIASLRRSVGGAKDTLRAESEKVRRDRGFLVREIARALERFRQLERELGELREFNILKDRRDGRQPDPAETPGQRQSDEPFGQSIQERSLLRRAKRPNPNERAFDELRQVAKPELRMALDEAQAQEKEREVRRLERAQTATATVERLDCIVLEDGRRIASFDLGTEKAARSFAVSCQREFPESRFEVARIIGRVVTREELEVQP